MSTFPSWKRSTDNGFHRLFLLLLFFFPPLPPSAFSGQRISYSRMRGCATTSSWFTFLQELSRRRSGEAEQLTLSRLSAVRANLSVRLLLQPFSSCVVWVPVDVVKERLQVQQGKGAANPYGMNYKGTSDALRTIARLEGVRGIYKVSYPILCCISLPLFPSLFIPSFHF